MLQTPSLFLSRTEKTDQSPISSGVLMFSLNSTHSHSLGSLMSLFISIYNEDSSIKTVDI